LDMFIFQDTEGSWCVYNERFEGSVYNERFEGSGCRRYSISDEER